MFRYKQTAGGLTPGKLFWLPGTCDLCGQHPAPVLYDFRTRSGIWTYGCQACYDDHGLGRLGTGYAQQYTMTRPETENADD